jgi:protein SCO1/2
MSRESCKFFGRARAAARRALCALAPALLPAAQIAPAQMGPAQVQQAVAFEQRINESLPLDAAFRDETGREVKLGDYFGRRPVILALVYYECPMLCTFVLNGLTRSLRALDFAPGRDFDVVAVSFNPAEEPALAAEKKAAYLRDFGRAGTDAGWHFLTGEPESIRRLTEAAGFRYVYDPGSRQYAHASGIIVATPQGRLYRYFYGIEYPPRDLRLGLVEASHNRLGTKVDQVMLYCFHYDPATGRYGLVVQNLLRLLGTGTVLLLGGFVFVMLRREKKGLRAA